MINCKMNGKFGGKEEITGLHRSGKASLKVPSLSTCLGSTCSRKGFAEVLERAWNFRLLEKAIQMAGTAQAKNWCEE